MIPYPISGVHKFVKAIPFHRCLSIPHIYTVLKGGELLLSRSFTQIPSNLVHRNLFRDCVKVISVKNCAKFSTGHSSRRSSSKWRTANKRTLTYAIAVAVAVGGLSYAAVPLYRLFCQATGYGGTTIKMQPSEKVEQMEPIRERELTIRFNADTSSAMLWNFKPQQDEIKLVPGETALAFYSARNPTDKPVTGIATYNVIPFEAGLYFNKIQCFCFEEQRLNPHEQVDMPVFFYIDPEFDDDPAMAKVEVIILSYTFFESKDGENLPMPYSNTPIPITAK